MSIWSILLLIGGMAIAGFSILIVWASVDVRKRFRERDMQDAVAAEEQAVIGCEGDCNTCPLQNLHVGLRKQIRAAELRGTSPMAATELGDNKLPSDVGAARSSLVGFSIQQV